MRRASTTTRRKSTAEVAPKVDTGLRRKSVSGALPRVASSVVEPPTSKSRFKSAAAKVLKKSGKAHGSVPPSKSTADQEPALPTPSTADRNFAAQGGLGIASDGGISVNVPTATVHMERGDWDDDRTEISQENYHTGDTVDGFQVPQRTARISTSSIGSFQAASVANSEVSRRSNQQAAALQAAAQAKASALRAASNARLNLEGMGIAKPPLMPRGAAPHIDSEELERLEWERDGGKAGHGRESRRSRDSSVQRASSRDSRRGGGTDLQSVAGQGSGLDLSLSTVPPEEGDDPHGVGEETLEPHRGREGPNNPPSRGASRSISRERYSTKDDVSRAGGDASRGTSRERGQHHAEAVLETEGRMANEDGAPASGSGRSLEARLEREKGRLERERRKSHLLDEIAKAQRAILEESPAYVAVANPEDLLKPPAGMQEQALATMTVKLNHMEKTMQEKDRFIEEISQEGKRVESEVSGLRNSVKQTWSAMDMQDDLDQKMVKEIEDLRSARKAHFDELAEAQQREADALAEAAVARQKLQSAKTRATANITHQEDSENIQGAEWGLAGASNGLG
ncbi:hypothetical protein CYMTET_50923 [Cymbomonas tetramitiformis]|uniref:Uncharacterized protein n=1 Tax=Cymbomonas tetramitiformis TaxID=36881 RepID=A0AAE0ESB7_9CHLO|nr:hypothetical protein CYMTET_50923 [Cymbomonas tetramitiformis]